MGDLAEAIIALIDAKVTLVHVVVCEPDCFCGAGAPEQAMVEEAEKRLREVLSAVTAPAYPSTPARRSPL